MMASKLLKTQTAPSKIELKIDRTFQRISQGYSALLEVLLSNRALVIGFALFVFASIPLAFKYLPTELIPVEDKGLLKVSSKGPNNANLDYMEASAKPFEKLGLDNIPEIAFTQVVAGKSNLNEASMNVVLKDWSERTRTQDEVMKAFNKLSKEYAPVKFSAYAMPEINTANPVRRSVWY